jgi:predicted RNA-binding Zn-ribbon protein involved in translation (DUF1610 family)
MQDDLQPRPPASGPAVTLQGEARGVPLLTREDFAASVRVYRRRNRSLTNWMLAAGMPGGLGLGYALIVATEQLGLEATLAWPAFSLGWLVALVSGGTLVMRERKLHRRLALHCPACGEAIISRSDPRRTDLVMATGRCATCGTRQFAPDEYE